MATHATGPPTTNFGIPTYDTDIDPPSGQGFNAAMAEIDTQLLAVRKQAVRKGGSLIGTRRYLNFIEGSGISLTIADDAGNDEVDITVTSTAAAPGYGTALPGSPTDGLEYILVDSTSAPTYQWRVRYNSTLTKWVFLGGLPKILQDDPNANFSTLTQVGATGYYYKASTLSFAVPNAGDYMIRGVMQIQHNSDGNISDAAVFSGSTLGVAWEGYPVVNTAQNVIAVAEKLTGLSASTTVGIAGTTANKKCRRTVIEIYPVSIT